MTAQGKAAAALALHRFGFGPAGDSMAAIAAIAGDPRGARTWQAGESDDHRDGSFSRVDR